MAGISGKSGLPRGRLGGSLPTGSCREGYVATLPVSLHILVFSSLPFRPCAASAVLASLLLATTLAGCSGGVTKPDWYQTPPEDASAIYATATASAQRKQVAIDKAVTSARGDLASDLATLTRQAVVIAQSENSSDSRAGLLEQVLEDKKVVDSLQARLDPRRSKADCRTLAQCLEGREQTKQSSLSRVLRETDLKRSSVSQREDGTYHAFVLLELPIQRVAEAIAQALSEP